MNSRISLAVSAGVVCAWLGGAAAAAGSIDTANADISAGAASVPGTVTIDAAAPQAAAPTVPHLRPLGGIGTFTVDLPAPDATDGSADAFVADASMTLAAGEYSYSTFDVAAGVVVTVGGDVTIHTRAAATVLGRIVSDGTASIRFDCGGGVALGEGAVVSTDAGEIVFDAQGDVTCAAGATMQVRDGSVTLRARKTDVAAGDIRLDGSYVQGVAADMTLQAEGSIVATSGAAIGATSGNMLVQAFGGDVRFEGGSGIWVNSTPDAARIEAQGGISLSGSTSLHGTGVHLTSGTIRLRAFGGAIEVGDGVGLSLTGGTIDLGARDAVRMTGTASAQVAVGTIRLTSFESDVLVQPSAATSSCLGTQAEIDLVAARDVAMSGAGSIVLNGGLLRCEAHGGSVTISDGFQTRASTGRLELLASGSISAADPHWLYRGGIALSAEGGQIDVDAGEQTVAGGSGFTAVAAGDLRLRGTVQSSGDLSLASCTGSVDASGTSLMTLANAEQTRSPSVFVESFAGDAGTIDVHGASIHTGDVVSTNPAAASGDVVLAVHDGKTATAEDGFVLAESVVAKRVARRPARSTIAVGGVLDGGPAPTLDGAATLTVGDRDIPITLVVVAGGRLRARGNGYDLLVTPSRTGSSRAKFSLKATSNPNGYLTGAGDGPMTLRLRSASFDVAGNVAVAKWRYLAGRVPGSLASPTIFPKRCELRPRDGGADAFTLLAGFAPTGATPSVAPDVRVTCGDGFVAFVPGVAFGAARHSVFTAVAPVAGVRRVVLDYVRGNLTIETSGIELGDFASSQGVTTVLSVALAGDQRAVRIRLGRGRGTLSY